MTIFNKLCVLFLVVSGIVVANTSEAAYTTTYTYYENETQSQECDWNYFSGIHFCTDGSGNLCANGPSNGWYKDCNVCGWGSVYSTLMKSSCQDLYWCTNDPIYSPGFEDVTVSVEKTGYTCHWISGVLSWNECSYETGTQTVDKPIWSEANSTTPFTDCSDTVLLVQNCGVCEPTAATNVYSKVADIYAPPILEKCKWGTIPVAGPYAVRFPDIYGEKWYWNCVRDGVPSPDCTANNSYIDIGLRLQDGAQTLSIGVEEETCFSPYRIRKGDITYCIGLLPPTTPTTHLKYTDARIQTAAGVKIINKLPAAPVCTMQNKYSLTTGSTYNNSVTACVAAGKTLVSVDATNWSDVNAYLTAQGANSVWLANPISATGAVDAFSASKWCLANTPDPLKGVVWMNTANPIPCLEDAPKINIRSGLCYGLEEVCI